MDDVPHAALGSAGAITVTGLTNGQSYDFQVAPANAIGQAAFSTVQTATPILNVAGLVGNGAWYAQATLEAATPGAVAGWADSGAHGRDLVGASGALTSVLADGAGINGLKAMHFATSRLEYVGGSPWITGPNLIVIMCRRILANSVNAAGMVLLDATQTNDFDNMSSVILGEQDSSGSNLIARRAADLPGVASPNNGAAVRGVPHLRRRELHAPHQRRAGRADREHRQLKHREDRTGHTLVQWGGTEPDDHAGRARAAGQRPGVVEHLHAFDEYVLLACAAGQGRLFPVMVPNYWDPAQAKAVGRAMPGARRALPDGPDQAGRGRRRRADPLLRPQAGPAVGRGRGVRHPARASTSARRSRPPRPARPAPSC